MPDLIRHPENTETTGFRYFLGTDTHGQTQTIISADMAEIIVWALGRFYILAKRTFFPNKIADFFETIKVGT